MDSVKCRNCGNIGHKLKNCRFPRLSYGIILFNSNNEIVMIEKRDSISYIEFIRGKYTIDNVEYIQLLIDRMSTVEKEKIIKLTFNELWNNIWYSSSNKKEYDKSENKYKQLIEKHILVECVNKSGKGYKYNEWEIPKGRRNLNESNKCCAIREFEEETNININYYDIYENIMPFEESYTGSNNINYKNVYYIASLKKNIKLFINENNNNQLHEVKDIKWININNYKDYVRDYSNYKLKVMGEIYKFLHSDYNDKLI
jgi:8-oxo-dGTP pyrophosphatase MutT (NUDIX family)